jgi:hypothetical protein
MSAMAKDGLRLLNTGCGCPGVIIPFGKVTTGDATLYRHVVGTNPREEP